MTAKIPVRTADDPDHDSDSDVPEPKEVNVPKGSKSAGAIYVDVDDDVTAIIGKVESAKNKDVTLVLPKRAGALQSTVNMRLLKRAADNDGKKLTLVSGESSLLPLAGAAGIMVAKNLQSKGAVPPSPVAAKATRPTPPPEDSDDTADPDDIDSQDTKLDYHRSVGELAAAGAIADDDEAISIGDDDEPEEEDEKTPKADEKKPKSKKIKVPNFELFRVMIFGGVALLIAVIVFVVLAIFVLPKSKVTVTTSATPVSVNLTLDASDQHKVLNEAANQIPATLKSTKQTSNQQVPATGQQNNGTKATGSVSMSAGACSGNVPSDVPAGTGVSASGVTFITGKTASFSPVISGGHCTFQSGSISITALTGGTKYNISFSSGSVAGYSNVSASGSASGGTDNITTVVSQADVDNAKQKAASGTTADTFTKQWEQQLATQGLYVLTSTIKASDAQTTATPAVGQPASTVNVTVVTTYTVLVVQKTDLQKAITDAFSGQINKAKQKINAADVVKAATVSVQNQTGTSSATIVVTEDGSAVPIIDADQVKKIAAGQKTGDIQTALGNWPGVKTVTVNLSPFWVSKTPKNANKITVVFVRANGQ